MTFFVGQKVERVGGSHTRSSAAGITPPEFGRAYTVANVYIDSAEEQHIELAELPSPARPGWHAGFRAVFFRPLVERKKETDISFALDILDKANRRITERV